MAKDRLERAEDRLERDAIFGLIAMGIGVLVVANDFTALSVALPAIEKTFNADVTTVQWVINGYAMVFGVLIVTGGRLADMFGRRRIFFIGTVIFGIFSVIGGLAQNVWLLLVCRGIMGIGGALMWPAILGMTYGLLPKSKAGLAGGIILGAAGIGNAMGPLLGGTLTDTVGWRWIFFVNLPVAAAAIAVVLLVVPRDAASKVHEAIDYYGMAALSVGLLALLLALDWGADRGWTAPSILGLFALSAVALVGFGFYERRVGNVALVPDDVMKNLDFAAAGITTLMMSAIFFAALLYLPQFMSKILGFSAIGAGAGLLPMMGTFAVTSFVAGRLYAIMGPKLIVSLGAALLAIGMFLLSDIHTKTTYDQLIFGMIVLGMGVGLFYSSITTAAITALDDARASLGGAIVYMFQIAGGSIGLGLNTAIVVTAPSLADGIHTAFLVDGALAVCGFVVSLLFVGGPIDKARLRSLRHHHRAHH
ncbi:MAG: MFS transporter [Hyphomicrobiaceae bacterium]|nr:MFS transporter [Hyphomicrobiaceae bacterium]